VVDKPGVAPGNSVCKTAFWPLRQARSYGAQESHLSGPVSHTGVVARRLAPRSGSPANRTQCRLLIRESRVTNPS